MEEVRKKEEKKKNLNPSSFKKRESMNKKRQFDVPVREIRFLSEVQETGCMEKISNKSRQQSQDQQSEACTSGARSCAVVEQSLRTPLGFFFTQS